MPGHRGKADASNRGFMVDVFGRVLRFMHLIVPLPVVGQADHAHTSCFVVAETGGLNVMVVDTSAPPEQVVGDVLRSAFNSTGQRCSALRLLCLRDEWADRVLTLLTGAVAELHVGDPLEADTDIGPVIYTAARDTLDRYIRAMERHHHLVAWAALPPAAEKGCYVASCVFELEHPGMLQEEVFGPVLHVVRYRSGELEALVDTINASGYGLTFGIHSRLDIVAQRVASRRETSTSTVTSAPWSGCSRLGAAGSPAPAPRREAPTTCDLSCRKSISIHTAAVGENAGLMAGSGE